MSEKIESDGWIRYLNDACEYHREDGFAYETASGSRGWLINGKYHRWDGPAYMHYNGIKEWWINGVEITDQAIVWIEENDFPDWAEWTDTHKLMFRLAFSGNNS